MPNMEKHEDDILKLTELAEKIKSEDKDTYLEDNTEFVNKILLCFDQQYEKEGKWKATDLEKLLDWDKLKLVFFNEESKLEEDEQVEKIVALMNTYDVGFVQVKLLIRSLLRGNAYQSTQP